MVAAPRVVVPDDLFRRIVCQIIDAVHRLSRGLWVGVLAGSVFPRSLARGTLSDPHRT
jgi:hypothetical protein